jgi:phage terminase large subunit-like protein
MYFATRVKAGDGNSTESPTNPERRNYIQWAQQGLCRIVEDTIIDDRMIVDYLFEVWETYQIRPFKIGYDRWHAKEFIKAAAQKFNLNDKTFFLDVPMNYGGLNVAMRNFEEDLRAGLVNYQNNEICRWNLRNTAIRHNNIGWIMPEKIKGFTGNKIDGTVTKIGCYAVLRQYKQEFLTRVGG